MVSTPGDRRPYRLRRAVGGGVGASGTLQHHGAHGVHRPRRAHGQRADCRPRHRAVQHGRARRRRDHPGDPAVRRRLPAQPACLAGRPRVCRRDCSASVFLSPIGLGFLAAMLLFPDVDLWVVALIATAVAPTDAALGAPGGGRPPGPRSHSTDAEPGEWPQRWDRHPTRLVLHRRRRGGRHRDAFGRRPCARR